MVDERPGGLRDAVDLAPLRFAYNAVVTNDDKHRVLMGAFPLLVAEIERLRSVLSVVSEGEIEAAARAIHVFWTGGQYAWEEISSATRASYEGAAKQALVASRGVLSGG